mmetsp:Transcript_9682/g.58526  ORF Transcript_9682/g.58526 Transcript_9682/m.58526 type:complete len:303 (-) Transcript_9682:2675-3583(-)|eukprot:CAMPEP_0113927344 /NCGR_PEP_ID=MMETSP1159-20121227/4255_1 /TAXON_ID=88271 /ORGANISM="Picocystis salinarum" /LENGTH=302 /DNA_ID=CAMNT_0000927831 /DNA_START=318 /DNA_END=1226 /DNA_ORIENTATION=+ /assembly_acc=CAM_ASM_000767
MDLTELLCSEECVETLLDQSHSPALSKAEWTGQTVVEGRNKVSHAEAFTELVSLGSKQMSHWVGHETAHRGCAIEAKERALAVEWLQHLRELHSLRWQTFGVAVNLLDRFLVDSFGFPINLLGLAATAAMMVATKMEEVDPPPFLSFLSCCMGRFSQDTLAKMEVNLLQVLKWEVAAVTPYHFADTILHAYGQDLVSTADAQEMSSTMFREELFEIIARIMTEDEFSCYLPSVIAFGALKALARRNRLDTHRIEGELYHFNAERHRWQDVEACCRMLEDNVLFHYRRAQSPRGHFESTHEFE